MTKPSPIMVAPDISVCQIPRADLEAFGRVLRCFRGLNEQHDRRWRRMWARVSRLEAGEILHIENVVGRSGPFHRMHMGMEQRLFDNQEAFANLDRFRDWLKTGAGWGHYAATGGRLRFVPDSTSYEQCSDDEMREVHAAMLEFLHRPKTQRRLWPHLTAAQRADKMEAILNPPTQEGA